VRGRAHTGEQFLLFISLLPCFVLDLFQRQSHPAN
jgi:hypothetical protein